MRWANRIAHHAPPFYLSRKPQILAARSARHLQTCPAPNYRRMSLERLCIRSFATCQPLRAKRKSTVRFEDLPQGRLSRDEVIAEDKEKEDEGPSYPTVIQQARNNMRKFENCVVLTRVGGFYELYLGQAEDFGPLLGLKVASKRTSVGPVAMAGFPFYQLDRFLKVLVQDHSKYVAISEEFPNDASGKLRSGGLMFDRKVTRVVTPGTLVDEKFMDPYENNFLLAIHWQPDAQGESPNQDLSTRTSNPDLRTSPLLTQRIGLAWVDLSTGEFYTESTSVSALPSELARIGAREIVLQEPVDPQHRRALLEVLGHYSVLVSWQPAPDAYLSLEEWTPALEAPVQEADALKLSNEELIAGSVLLNYSRARLIGQGLKLQPPIKRSENEHVGIDKSSMRGLEVLRTSGDATRGGKGSLLHSVRRTVTESGARLLRERISSPSTSLSVINQRLDLAQQFIEDATLRESVVALLKRTFDSQRIVQRFSLGRGDADDLVSLLQTITITNTISQKLVDSATSVDDSSEKLALEQALRAMQARLYLKEPNALASRISSAIDEDALQASHSREQAESATFVSMAQGVLQSEGEEPDFQAMAQVMRAKAGIKAGNEPNVEEEETWIMRKTASKTLEKLHAELARLRQEKVTLASHLKKASGAQSLTLRWTPALGYICHVKGKDVNTSAEPFQSARSVNSRSTRSIFLKEWTTLGGQIDQMKMQIRAEEQQVFHSLREDVIRNLIKLRRNAAVLDELDVACSSATLAIEENLVRPIINGATRHKIVGGRHPTVKLGLEEQGRMFVTNDCFLGGKERVWFVSGPNMAGKSTFLRQNALISILAQVGCFVPAEHAEIGIVDQIFSRIGAADNLYHDQSTFMVEMLETAQILRRATPRSFVIMDEVGRGTTPTDGIAVGFACLHHLLNVNKCRTLFATHFHDLADMTSTWDGIGFYCTDVREDSDGSFRYVHKLRNGVNHRSHALKVAHLAGMPEAAIEVARQVLGMHQTLPGLETTASIAPTEVERVKVTAGG